MKKIVCGFLIIILFHCFSGCTDVSINHTLSITNKSNTKISILYSNEANKRSTENNIAYFIRDQNIIPPDSSFDIPIMGRRDAWHQYINEGNSKKLYIYIFSVDSLTKANGIYSMDELVNKKKYLELTSYSEEQLSKINWQITFK